MTERRSSLHTFCLFCSSSVPFKMIHWIHLNIQQVDALARDRLLSADSSSFPSLPLPGTLLVCARRDTTCNIKSFVTVLFLSCCCYLIKRGHALEFRQHVLRAFPPEGGNAYHGSMFHWRSLAPCCLPPLVSTGCRAARKATGPGLRARDRSSGACKGRSRGATRRGMGPLPLPPRRAS